MSKLELGNDMPAANKEAWLEAVDAALRGKSVDHLVSTDLAGFTRQPLYTQDTAPSHHSRQNASGLPGFAPFTRGARVVNNRFLPWHIAQRLTPGRKGSDNAAAITDLTGGVTALLVDFSDQLLGVDALDALLDGVMLDIAPLSIQPGPHGLAAAETILALRETRGLDPQVPGYLNLDPLSASLRYASAQDIDLARLVEITQGHDALCWMTASGATWHDMGASLVQELAWVLSSVTQYLRQFEAIGIDPAVALPKITITLATDGDFFASLSKIRAARLLFANLAAGLGVEAIPQIHVETSRRALSDVDPWVNILRATVSGMAAGIAGVDMMTIAACTATSDNDNELTRRIARNTQIILQEESHIGQVADAAGGSWYVESLTDQLSQQAWAIFQQIEAAGGLAASLEKGDIAAAVNQQRADFDRAIDNRSLPLVGVSEFPNLDEAALPMKASGPAEDEAQTGLGAYRFGARYEGLRRTAQKSKPKVFLACLGDMASYTPRLNFAANLYAVGGLHAVSGSGGFETGEIVAEFAKSTAKIAVICGSDEDYETHADALAKALREAGTVHLALAGKPRENDDMDDYCYAGGPAYALLAAIHQKLGL
ncbi:methylmalonyl-CoA mutase family protein [Alphaproteobacteria bacterium]|nr:methylmalonyl-CoA mutase family protein [Alphaproteobacteria bacterium]